MDSTAIRQLASLSCVILLVACSHAAERCPSPWKLHIDQAIGVSFQYPPGASVTEGSDTINSSVTITSTGSWVGIEYGATNPYDNPPLGTNVHQWIFHNPNYPSTYTGTGTTIPIAALPTLRAFTNGDSDTYFVLNGTKLYSIVVLHVPRENQREVRCILRSIRMN